MKSSWLFVSGAVCGAAVSAVLPRVAIHLHETASQITGGIHSPTAAIRAHTEEKFAFIAHAPMEEVAPLFGAKQERGWSPHWDPQFIYPLPAADAEGMVFAVKHGGRSSIWINTDFDVKNGRVQYVYIIPDTMTTVITIRLKSEGSLTNAEVQYDRTALTAEAETLVRRMAEQDRRAGPFWEAQMNGYLERRKGSTS